MAEVPNETQGARDPAHDQMKTVDGTCRSCQEKDGAFHCASCREPSNLAMGGMSGGVSVVIVTSAICFCLVAAIVVLSKVRSTDNRNVFVLLQA